MIPGINIRGKAAQQASTEPGTLVGERKPNKFSGTKERLDWLKIDLNAVKIITAQDYKRTKN